MIRRERVAGRLKPAAALLAVAIAACSSDKDVYVERPVDDLYNDAMNNLEAGDYKKSAKLFDEVERQHPYSPWATKSELMSAYAYYKADLYDEAIGALDRYIELHPASPDVPYAYYLKGLSYYERISDIHRDQEMTQSAKKVFGELIARYPTSEYARDARLKIELCNDHLAGKEMTIGRYYGTRGHYLAAINRFRTVVSQYQTTTHVPEALLRLTESYTALGLTDEARRTAAVLGYNFPGSDWYADAYRVVGGGSSAEADLF